MNWDEIEKKVDKGKDDLYRKGRACRDIITVKGQISTCKDIISRDYVAIGKMYVEMFKEDNPHPEFDKKLREIINAENAIVELEAKLENIKGSM